MGFSFGATMKKRRGKPVPYSYAELKRIANESGLAAIEYSSTHWQVVLPDGQLNIWPTTSKGLLDRKGDRSPANVSSLEHVRASLAIPKPENHEPKVNPIALRIVEALERIADALEKESVPY
jgi:hypothetical protein